MSNGPNPLIQRARRAIERRDYVAALADLREVVDSHPQFADVHQMLGLCLSMMGEPEEALAEFDRALAANPYYVEAHLNRAITLNDLGRFDDASEAFSLAADAEARAAGRFPGSVSARIANAHAAVGDLYRAAHAPAEAAAEYRLALALRPEFPDIRNKLADALLDLGAAEEARVELERTLRARPDYFPARLNLGLALLRMGDGDGARAAWEECHALHPDNPQLRAYFQLLEDAGDAGAATDPAATDSDAVARPDPERSTEEHAGGAG